VFLAKFSQLLIKPPRNLQYWMMPLPWVYRALLLNEFTSDDYAEGDPSEGEKILASWGFMYKGEPFTREWIGYCFAYLIPFVSKSETFNRFVVAFGDFIYHEDIYSPILSHLFHYLQLLLCMVASAACLNYLRMEPKPASAAPEPETEEEEEKDDGDVNESPLEDSFIPVDLSFKDLCYDVKSSKGSEKLRLLNNVSGVFSAGRMCALMGESGAGKTTLMDVIALRKASGNISGEVLLNGFPQEKISFRRCSGYVEQFDVQSAELTVRETIRFSAQLRLERSNPVFDSPNGLEDHVDYIIKTLELTREADILVGNEEEGGLTFEQKKRLSIAVELAVRKKSFVCEIFCFMATLISNEFGGSC